MMSLGEFLSARKLSCAEFARTLGVRDTTVLRWMKRDREPTVAWAFAIERATGGLVPASAWLPESHESGTRRRTSGAKRRSVRPSGSRRGR